MKLKGQVIHRFSETIYWLITFLVFAFVAKVSNEFGGEVLIFHITATKWFVHFRLLLIYIVFLFVVARKIFIDKIEILLFAKLVLDIVSTCIVNQPESFAYIVWTNIGFLTYLTCRNLKADLHRVLVLFEMFAVILSVQTLATALKLYRMGIMFHDFIFKQRLLIPYAGSNLIASIISAAMISMLARFEYDKTNKAVLIAKFVIYSAAILIIRSRGSLLLLLMVLDLTFLLKIIRTHNNQIRLVMYALLISINLSVIVYCINSSLIWEYFSRYISGSNDITSGRLEIWRFAWNEFVNNPVVGRGISYDPGPLPHYTGAHNLWLDTMMSSGMLGFILHIITIATMFNKIKVFARNNKLCGNLFMACVMALLFLYLDSMIEVSYYNYINDTIFWSLCGTLVAYMSKKESLSEKNVYLR